MFVNREIAVSALTQLVRFHEDACSLFRKHGMDLLSDLGRRNTLLSSVQEKFFSDSLRDAGFTVSIDPAHAGRPGQPDIVVTDKYSGDTLEIECKLTTRNSHGGIVLQTDYDTLLRKGSLDYLYVIASPEFKEFCVIYFKGLTAADFNTPSRGSRGKARMIKHRCHEKSTVLFGEYTSLREKNIRRAKVLLDGKLSPSRRKQCEKSLAFWTSGQDKFRIVMENLSIVS